MTNKELGSDDPGNPQHRNGFMVIREANVTVKRNDATVPAR